MSRTSSLRYAVVDLETTGGRPDRDKITEIAIVIHNGHEIIETFSSLINPGVTIPPMITSITGITQEMVDDAPPFYEVAKQVAMMTEHCVFVAHNVRFDYQFLREAFSDLGFTYTRPHICTVKMTRKAFPGLPSYSLGNLIRHFGISVKSRHRALDDALATAKLLEMILAEEQDGLLTSVTRLTRSQQPPEHLPQDLYDRVPDACGIYYFYNQLREVIYVGKSKHIRQRLKEHLRAINGKAARLDRDIADIDWVITGSELYAAVLESYEIRRLMPAINKTQRNRHFPAAIYQTTPTSGYIRFKVGPTKDTDGLVNVYPSSRAARSVLEGAVDRFGLCWHLTLENKPGTPCYKHHLGTCLGACVREESPDSYNERISLAAAALGSELEGSFLLIDKGPDPTTRTCIQVEQGSFCAMGMVSLDSPLQYDELADQLKPYPDHPEIRRLIRQFMVRQRIQRIPRP